MSSTIKKSLVAAAVLALVVSGYFGLRGKAEPIAQQGRGQQIQSVRIAVAEKKSIPVTLEANGYVTAINTVDVHPRIQQIVRSVDVREGQEVRAGQLLFTLDSRNDTSGVDKAQAQVVRDRADLEDAEIALKRNQELLVKSFVSQAVVDSARNKVESLRAALHADQANAEASNIALGYNQISASISGRIGIISVHPGSLAQPAGLPMVTITQMDPVAVSFSVPERELANISSSYPNWYGKETRHASSPLPGPLPQAGEGDKGSLRESHNSGNAPVTAQLPDGREFKGKLIFIDSSADQQSGTIRMKAQFANPDRQLWPGAFVNVRMVSRTLPDAVVVPAQAVVSGPSNQFVYIVQPDSTVQARKVAVRAIENGFAAVDGLDAGTRIVVEGMQNLRTGSKVKEAQAAPPDSAKPEQGKAAKQGHAKRNAP